MNWKSLEMGKDFLLDLGAFLLSCIIFIVIIAITMRMGG